MFAIQLSLKNHQIENYVKSLKKHNLDYTFFSVYSDNDLIDNLPEVYGVNPFISLASIKGLKISQNLTEKNFNSLEEFNLFSNNFKKSFFYDIEKFDQKYYKNLDIPLLNKESEIINLKNNLKRKFERDVFIKPTSDLKGFVGGILKKGETIEDFINGSKRMPNWIEETTLISEVKDIHSEYRFFIVDNEVVGSSRYMLEKSVIPSKDIPEEVNLIAPIYAKLYNPNRVFTMDLALLKNGSIEIVEYNCFNGSGTYDADLDNLVDVLSKFEIK
jgi:hypothetical protein